MRRKALKKIEQFVDKLIANSKPNELGNKSRAQLINEVKTLWVADTKTGKEFIDSVLSGKYDGLYYRLKEKK